MEPYKAGLVQSVKFLKKSPVVAQIVTVMKGNIRRRGMELIHPASRAVKQGDIIELSATKEKAAAPGATVQSVHYLGFAEITLGGVILVKDKLRLGKKVLGKVVGFDECHYPNHLNVVISPEMPPATISNSLGLEEEITFSLR